MKRCVIILPILLMLLIPNFAQAGRDDRLEVSL